MKLTEISYPVYRIGNIKPTETLGELSLEKVVYEDDTVVRKKLVIDNKNILGNTLAVRRLRLKAAGVLLYKLKIAIFFPADLLKLATSKTWFIDNNGKLFKYVKTRSVRLIFKRITKVIPVKTGGAILEIEGLAPRYKCLASVPPDKKYAGILEIGYNSYMLYGTYAVCPKNTRRKI